MSLMTVYLKTTFQKRFATSYSPIILFLVFIENAFIPMNEKVLSKNFDVFELGIEEKNKRYNPKKTCFLIPIIIDKQLYTKAEGKNNWEKHRYSINLKNMAS